MRSLQAVTALQSCGAGVQRLLMTPENHIAGAGQRQSDTNGTFDSRADVEPFTIKMGLSVWN